MSLRWLLQTLQFSLSQIHSSVYDHVKQTFQVPTLAPPQNLSRIFLALDPAALKIVDDTGLRPLHLVLEALDKGVPSWWNETFWADSAGGPDWVAPVPTTSTVTRTTTSTQDLESLLCNMTEVPCAHTVKFETF